MKFKKIIIIDDDINVLSTIFKIVEVLGYTGKCFSDFESAIDYIETNEYSLVLSDYIVKKDASDVENLTKLCAIAKSPVVILTGFYGEEIVNLACKIGVANCISKPVNIKELADCIEEFC